MNDEIGIDALLEAPAEHAVRRLALGLLDAAVTASERLDAKGDADALHDFRVAIRRLRSCERAYRETLADSFPKKLRRRLRELGRKTTAGRDAEVQAEWLAGARKRLSSRGRSGIDYVRERLEEERRDAYGNAEEIAGELGAIDRKLRGGLESYHIDRSVYETPHVRTFAEACARALREHTDELRDKLTRIRSASDEAAAHDARISAKRLRYLIEPIVSAGDAGESAVKELKALQTLLGSLHDMHVLSARLGTALQDAARDEAKLLHAGVSGGSKSKRRRALEEKRRDERAGILRVTRVVHERVLALFDELSTDWLQGRAEALFAAVVAVADALDRRAPEGADLEIERKYLLHAIPERARRAPSAIIEQGWLPGRQLRERIRRVKRSDGTVELYRAIKLGQGIARIEIEEATPPDLFAKLWPLTRGARVRKRRYFVEDGDLTWEIDQFLDRDLALGEVELESADIEPELPEWLAPCVVREVTGEAQYVNLNLAK